MGGGSLVQYLILLIVGIVGFLWLKKRAGQTVGNMVVTKALSLVSKPAKDNGDDNVSQIEHSAWQKLIEEQSLTTAQKATFDSKVRDLAVPFTMDGKVVDVDEKGRLSINGEIRISKPWLKDKTLDEVFISEIAYQATFPSGEFAAYRKAQVVNLTGIITSATAVFTTEHHMFAFQVSECSIDGHQHDGDVAVLRFMTKEEIRAMYFDAAINHQIFFDGMSTHARLGE